MNVPEVRRKPPTEPRPEVVQISWLLVAVASAGIAAWIQLAARHLPWLSNRLAFTDRHTFWITLLSYLLFLVPVGVAAVLISRFVAPLRSVQSKYFLQVFPAVFGVAWLLHPRIHRYGILVLSIGIAVQLARIAAGRPAGLRRVAWGVGLASAALAATGVVFAGILPALSEQRALRSPSARSAGAPNVLLLVLDNVRASSLSVYGYQRPTSPLLQEFSRRAVLFRNAFATTSWTLPSHASMFTGRYPYELSSDWEHPLDNTTPVLAEVFRDAGFRVGGFVGNIEYTSAEVGLARGFSHFEDWPVSFPRVVSESSLGFFLLDNPLTRSALGFHEPYVKRYAVHVIDGFLHWKNRTDSLQRPYFAFLNLYDAHAPWIPPEPYLGRFGAAEARQRQISFDRLNGGALRPRQPLTPAELEEEQRAYDSGIAYLDAQIGRLLQILQDKGELDSTLVVITSDHGEHFGEFGLRSHGTALYSPGLHVPLLIAYPPTVPANRTVDRAVTLRDLPSTVLDIAGIQGHPIPGASLATTWGMASSNRDESMILAELWPPRNVEQAVPVAGGYMRSLVDWPFQLIVRADGAVEFLDLTNQDAAAELDTTVEGKRRAMERRLRAVPPTTYAGRDTRAGNDRGDAPPRRPR